MVYIERMGDAFARQSANRKEGAENRSEGQRGTTVIEIAFIPLLHRWDFSTCLSVIGLLRDYPQLLAYQIH